MLCDIDVTGQKGGLDNMWVSDSRATGGTCCLHLLYIGFEPKKKKFP